MRLKLAWGKLCLAICSRFYISAILIFSFRGSVCALVLAAVRLRAMAPTRSDGGLTADDRGGVQGVGRGRSFARVRPGRDGSSGTFGLTAVSSGAVRAGPALMDGGKRPISSPPSLLPSQSKKNRMPSDPDPCSDLSCGDMSQTLMRRIDDFFYPPPCDPSSDLLWSKPHEPLQDVLSDASPPP